MHKHLIRTLLFLGASLASILLVVYHDIHVLAWLWFWSAREIFASIGLAFLLRRIQRPAWSVITPIVIALSFGFATKGQITRYFVHPVQRSFVWWAELSSSLRMLVGFLAACAAALLIWLHWEMYVLFPFASSWVRKIDYMTGDRLLDKLSLGWRWRVNRFKRQNSIARGVLKHPRSLKAFVLKRSERFREERARRKTRREESPK